MCEYYRERSLPTLPGVAKQVGLGKHVVLAFAKPDNFFDYVCDFYPDEGEFGAAPAMFLHAYYRHIALCTQLSNDLGRTIAHEMTHCLFEHLRLPLWLNEGLTCVVDDIVIGQNGFLMSAELAKEHRQYWNEKSIQAFWSGNAFRSSDDGRRLSYSLAEVLVRNLMSHFPDRFLDVVISAKQSRRRKSSVLRYL